MSQVLTKWFNGDNGKFELTMTEAATSASTNKSTWTATLKFYYYYNIAVNATKNYSMTINGTTYSGTFTIGTSSSGVTKTLRTVSDFQVSHNSDGTKSFSVSFSCEVKATLSNVYYGSVTGSKTITASTIPRATTPSFASSGYLGNALAISLPRASSSFTHKVEHNVSGSWATATSSAGTSYNLSLSTTWGTYFKTTTSKTFSIKVTTYSGSTVVGASATKSFTVKVPDSAVPSISAVSVVDTISKPSGITAYVQGKSKPKYTITAAGAYSSNITKYAVTLEGTADTVSTSATSCAITSKYTVKTSGTVSATITVTDSRGRTKSTTKSISVASYSTPAATNVKAYRATSSGTISDSGTSLRVEATYSIPTIGNTNTNSWRMYYKKTDATTWTTGPQGTGYSKNGLLGVASGVLEADYSYDVLVRVTDSFGYRDTTTTVGTTFQLIDVTNEGIAVGKASENNKTLEVALPTVFSDDVQIGTVQNVEMCIGRNIYVSGTATMYIKFATPPSTVSRRTARIFGSANGAIVDSVIQVRGSTSTATILNNGEPITATYNTTTGVLTITFARICYDGFLVTASSNTTIYT